MEIWACARQGWQIGLGDPGLAGWLIVILYAATAALAWRVARRASFPVRTRSRERLFWYVLTALLLLLAVNKQLDLQSLLTAVARCAAQIQGWYEARRIVQIGFIFAVFALMVFLFVTLWSLLQGTLRRSGLALVGLVFVLGFVGIRAAGFHHMDRLIDMRLSSMRLNWILEMTGPALISLAALLLLHRARGKRHGRDRRHGAQ